MKRALKIAVLTVLLAVSLNAGPPFAEGAPARKAATPVGKIVPVATGPATQLSNELNTYAAFPAGTELPDGSGYLVSYSVGSNHFTANTPRFRYSADGVAWSDPWTPAVGSGTFNALAAETLAQGGRVYGLQTKLVVTGTTVTSVTPYFRWSDDMGRTWSAPAALAGAGTKIGTAAGTWSFYSSSITVLADGSLLIAGYGRADGHVLVRRSTDRGVSWNTEADIVPPAGRVLQEPQLCVLADGRVAMPMRSDASTSQWLYMSTRSADGSSWSAPRVINFDASGQPSCREVADGQLATMYRGWTDRSSDEYHPMRLGIMGVDVGTWGKGDIALDPNETGRFTYGVFLKAPDGTWLAVHGIEGPLGAMNPSAQIWVTPMKFLQVPS